MVEFRENPVILARMFYAEAKDGTPGKDLPVGKDVDRALMERLQGLTPKFLYIRGAMGVGPEVGFGSLPLTHVSGEGFSIATLPHIKPIGEGNPILHYQILSGIFGSEVKYIAMNPFLCHFLRLLFLLKSLFAFFPDSTLNHRKPLNYFQSQIIY